MKPTLVLFLLALAVPSTLSAQINVPLDQPTISAAIAAATPGTTITVASGVFVENLLVDERVSIVGAGSNGLGTTIIGTVTIAASGLSAGQPVLLQALRITGADDGVRFSSAQSFVRFDDVDFFQNSAEGIDFNLALGVPVTDIEIASCSFLGNAHGIRTSSNANVERVTITGSDFIGNLGTGILLSGANNTGQSITRDWSVTGGVFEGNDVTDTTPFGGGMWLRTSGAGSEITNFAISNVIFRDNGSANPFNRFGVSVFARNGTTVTNVTIDGCTFQNTAAGGTQTVGVAVDVGATGNLTTPVAISNSTFRDLVSAVNGFLGTFTLTGNTFINVASPVVPPVGNGPIDVAIVDYDDNGTPDIVTANMGDDTLSLLANDGTGIFDDPAVSVPLTVGDAPRAVVGVATVGGNQVAVACAGSGSLRFVDGGLVVQSVALTNQSPVDLAAGDFDSDGNEDVAVALEGDLFLVPGTVEVVINGVTQTLANGSGTSGAMKAVAVADLNGDGNLDVAAIQAGGFATPTANLVMFWFGDGLGGFVYSGMVATTQTPVALDCYDVTGDGECDFLVSVGTFANPATAGVLVLENTGVATYSAFGPILGGLAPLGVRGFDRDDDSLPGFINNADMVTIDSGQSLTLHRNYGAGSFASFSTSPLFVTATSLEVGDLDGDNTPDVVVTAIGINSAIVLLSGTPALAQPYGAGCAGTGGILTLSGAGVPTFDNPTYTLNITNGRPFAPALLAVSGGYENIPLGGGCSLYLESPFVLFNLFTDLSGSASFTFGTPPAIAPFVGFSVFAQAAVFDPLAAGNLALSNGLRLKFGYALLP